MTAYDRLDLLFQQNNGIVKTAQVLEIGIAKSTFYAYAKQRGVEQAAHGVYVSPDAWTDAMYLLHLRCAQAVFSHESALFFHDLTDREPNPYSITPCPIDLAMPSMAPAIWRSTTPGRHIFIAVMCIS